MTRTVWGVFVVGFWLVMMASLVRTYLLPLRHAPAGETLEAATLADGWQDFEEWMEVRSRDRRLGFTAVSMRKEKQNGGYRVVSRASLDVAAPAKARIDMTAVAQLNGDFQLDSFWVHVAAPLLALDVSGFVWGERLYVKFVVPNDKARRAYWPLEQPVSLLEALRPLAARKIDLEEGAEYRVRAFDPIWFGGAGEAVIRVGARQAIQVGGQTVDASPVETILAGRRSVAWVDDSRTIVRYEILEGLTFERVGRDAALQARPDFPAEPALPRFEVDEYAQSLELMDLSQGNPLGTLAGILIDLATPKS